jgi:hypothetical protein
MQFRGVMFLHDKAATVCFRQFALRFGRAREVALLLVCLKPHLGFGSRAGR